MTKNLRTWSEIFLAHSNPYFYGKEGFQGGSGTELELETGTVGTVFPETESGTGTARTVFPGTTTGIGTVLSC